MKIKLTNRELIKAIYLAARQDGVSPDRVVQECMEFMLRTNQVLLAGLTEAPAPAGDPSEG